jgi:hypothetical protein
MKSEERRVKSEELKVKCKNARGVNFGHSFYIKSPENKSRGSNKLGQKSTLSS